MDPAVTTGCSGGGRLPRERGDGPRKKVAPANPVFASPASAGMDPAGGEAGNGARGLPRERGDGPQSADARQMPGLPPPRARGWTLPADMTHAGSGASPASAGMDRRPSRRTVARTGLPRERGDGPPPTWPTGWPPPPPRARGWTGCRDGRRRVRPASPASAGMDRESGLRLRSVRCLPRERGDGPFLKKDRRFAPRPPPRARGWTSRRYLRARNLRASPASAGMDPSVLSIGYDAPCLPRERGDGPWVIERSAFEAKPPPRARGWTEEERSVLALDVASPASAGMDPPPRTAPTRCPRLPRERGDGPVVIAWYTRVRGPPPRARGWTVPF